MRQSLSVRTQPAVASLAEPHRERITRWWRQGIQGTTIHGALVRSHGFTGSYSSVRRFLAGLEAAHPQVTTALEFDPGEAAQVDFGKGPEVLGPRGADRDCGRLHAHGDVRAGRSARALTAAPTCLLRSRPAAVFAVFIYNRYIPLRDNTSATGRPSCPR